MRPLRSREVVSSSPWVAFDVGVSDEAGEIGREANALEDFLVGPLGKVVVDDLLARLLTDFRGEFGEGVRNITAELIDLAGMPGSREDDGRGFCIVRAGGGSEATFAGRADDGAALKRWTKRGGVVLQVRAVAEKDTGDSGADEVPLGSEVFRPNQECRGLGTEDGGISEELRAGSLGGIDHGFVFRDADALGGQGGRRYEQNARGSSECSGERCGFAVVSFANMHAECSEVCRFGWRARPRRSGWREPA